jgi:ubiquitin-protein ligase
MAAVRRIKKELKDLGGIPGLAISSNESNPMSWCCTYACPKFYRRNGEQRQSPYEGFFVQFSINFPQDYPFKPFTIRPCTTPKAIFHPLITYDGSGIFTVPLGLAVNLGDEWEQWSPHFTVRLILERSIVPMWSDANAWLEAPQTDCCQMSRAGEVAPELFPAPPTPFQGDAPPHERTWENFELEVREEQQRQATAAKESAEEYAISSVQVKTLYSSGAFLVSGLKSSDSVQELKARIRELSGIPLDRQKLIFAGKRLADWRTLGDYNVTSDCTVSLGLKLRGCTHLFHGNGYNEVAVHYLCEDIRRFELLARESVQHPLGALSDQFSFLASYVVGSDPERLSGVLAGPAPSPGSPEGVHIADILQSMDGLPFFIGPTRHSFNSALAIEHPDQGWNACLAKAREILAHPQNADLRASLSVAHAALLRLYTSEAPHLYALLNGVLRAATPEIRGLYPHGLGPLSKEEQAQGDARRRVLPLARLFYDALHTLTPRLRPKQRLWRREAMAHPDFLATFVAGKTWGVCAFTSFTTQLGRAPAAPGNEGRGTIHAVNNCPGFDLRPFSVYPMESEVLVCAGSMFTTRSIDSLVLPSDAAVPGSMRTVESDFVASVSLL